MKTEVYSDNSDYASDEACSSSNPTDSGRASPEPESLEKIENSKKVSNPEDSDILLNDSWTLSYREKASKGNKAWTFGENEQIVATVSTFIQFWQVINHVKTPSTISKRNNPNMSFFRKGITPAWEDKSNRGGGMWLLTIKTGKFQEQDIEGVLDKVWFESLVACVMEDLKHSDYITGIVLARRQREDRIQIWTKASKDLEAQTTIGKELKALFQHSCPKYNTEMNYTSHDSLQQTTSIRATNITKHSSMHCDRHMSHDSGAETTPDGFHSMRKDVSFGRRMSHVGKLSIR